jgi:hypothetical protein
MSQWQPLPDEGLRIDLSLRLGDTLGPFRVELADEDKAAFLIAGATVFAELWARATPSTLVPMTAALFESRAIDYQLPAAASAVLTTQGTWSNPQSSSHFYRVGYTLAGVKKTIVQGAIATYAGQATA